MKNEKIAQVLKDTRKKNNMSIRQVASQLENHSLHVAEKTIYGWESGQSQPDADTLLVLCEIYDINDILGTFGYKESQPFHITQHEKDLIMRYRKHPEMHIAIDRLLQ